MEAPLHTAARGSAEERLILGWEEWVALPGLAIPSIKAKIDTGAKTSALHAESIEASGPPSVRRVSFVVRPLPRRPDIAVRCSAPVIDRRSVVSSNGIPEERYVIETLLAVGGERRRIEITLSDRREMHYRMLIGRQALQAGRILVDPSRSFVQPRLGARAYGRRPKPKP